MWKIIYTSPSGVNVWFNTHTEKVFFGDDPEKAVVLDAYLEASEAMGDYGMKYDNEKPRPSLLFRSLNKAVQGVIAVLEYGAKKYAPDNWKLIEQHRYEDALARHYLAFTSGETHDPESGLPHIDHILCCALFISEKGKEDGKY